MKLGIIEQVLSNVFTSKVVVVFWFLALLTSCAQAPVLPPVTEPPRENLQLPLITKDRPVIAFVLGSGAVRGFAHVGVLKVFEESGIQADIVVGSSAGSVVGALYAGGIRGKALVDAAHQLNIAELTDWMFPNRGVVRGERLQIYVNQLLQYRPIEALPTKFVAVVTDLESGALISFTHGDTGMAVRASSAIPGLVQPMIIGEREYVDGGLVSQVPVRVARKLGADIVIAVDVSRKLFTTIQLESTFAVMQQAYIIMAHKIAEAEIDEADVIIRPDVGNLTITESELRQQALDAGETAARGALFKIKQMIAEKSRMKNERQ